MPSSTFHNLTKHKREKILSESMVEFARHPYERASLSELVLRLGIAKGSMYQYFEDKKDLYKYVINQVYQQKRAFLQSVWDQRSALDFFELVNLYYRRSWQFAREHPLEHQVITNFWDSRDEQVRAEILKEKEVRNIEFADLLQQWSENDLISKGLNPKATWFVYHAVGKALIDNFVSQDVCTDAHIEFIDSVLNVLELGLRTRKE